MDFFGGNGCGCNSSCDVLTWVILIWIIKKLCCKRPCDGGHGMGPDMNNCGDNNGCVCGIKLDCCTIIILLIFLCGNKFCK